MDRVHRVVGASQPGRSPAGYDVVGIGTIGRSPTATLASRRCSLLIGRLRGLVAQLAALGHKRQCNLDDLLLLRFRRKLLARAQTCFPSALERVGWACCYAAS